MQYPEFVDLAPSRAVRDGMIRDIAWQERDSLRRPPQTSPSYSERLGNLCMVYDDERQGGLRTVGAPNPEERVYRGIHDIVLSATPEDQQGIQRELHSVVIAGIERLLKRTDQNSRGKMGEYVCLALHTRYAHPRIQAYFALRQYEGNADKSGHFDVGAVYGSPSSDDVESHYLQVKHACFGQCGRKATENIGYTQRGYRDFIQFVSACCHLRLKNNASRNGYFQVPKLLVAESQDAIAPDGLKLLDNLTDGLLFSASADLLPRGTKNNSTSDMATGIAQLRNRFKR